MGKFTAYKVDLAGKADGHYEQDFEIGKEFFENMENNDILASDIRVHMDMDKRNDAYYCVFHCKGLLQIPCDRCLDPMDHDVDTEYKETVKYGDNYNDGADNLLVIPYSNKYLNVAYMLYDTILLTIPIRHVHPQGKCNRAMLEALRKHRGSAQEEDDDADEIREEARQEAVSDMENDD